MWIRKVTRDRAKGVDSPMPTQVVSNEEFTPRRQSEAQKKVEYLIGEMATERSAKLGIDRKSFLRSTMGMATCFLAANRVDGAGVEGAEGGGGRRSRLTIPCRGPVGKPSGLGRSGSAW